MENNTNPIDILKSVIDANTSVSVQNNPAPSETTEKSTKHRQINKEIGCIIPFSRSETVMIDNIINKKYNDEVDKLMAEFDKMPGHVEAAKLKTTLDEFKKKNKVDHPNSETFKEQINKLQKNDKESSEGLAIKEKKKLLSESRTRVSVDAPIVGSVLAQNVIESCFRLALSNTNKPIVSVSNLLSSTDKLEASPYWAFFRDGKNFLRVFKKFLFDEQAKNQKQILEQYKSLMALKGADAKNINYNKVATDLGIADVEPATITQDIVEESNDTAPNKYFYSYVHHICKDIIKTIGAEHRIQSDLCELISEITYDSLTTVGLGIAAYFQYETVKTIRGNDVEQIIKIILHCSGRFNNDDLFKQIAVVRKDNENIHKERIDAKEESKPEEVKLKKKAEKEKKELLAKEMKLLDDKLTAERKKEAEAIKLKILGESTNGTN